MTAAEDGAAIAAARRMSHGEQLARTARLHPGRVAFQFEEQHRTYAELDERVTRLARALAARGVGRGDRVAVFVQNHELAATAAAVRPRVPGLHTVVALHTTA
jgi:fatty-acyl-CoA synthase